MKHPVSGSVPPLDDDYLLYLSKLRPGPHQPDEQGYGGLKDYLTPPKEAELPGPWLAWEGGSITPLPLLDKRTGLYARLSYAGALEAAKRLGGRLPTWQEALKIWQKGARIKPVQLVFEKYDQLRMKSLAYAVHHDKKVADQLEEMGWDGKKPVANVGKWWVAGAAPGHAWLYGWWENPKSDTARQGIPAGEGHHDDAHHDYGTLTYLVRP